jgi:uncharacterized glyoxalase superfamily protein PhnB
MSSAPPPPTCGLAVTLRYADAPAAVEFLEAAFGFASRLVVPDEGGGIRHAQLVLGGAMVMLSSARDEPGTLLPSEAGGVTSGIYVTVADIDAHYLRAVAAGADITLPLAAQEERGAMYSARDCEGHRWHFGAYDPWTS